MRRSFGTMWLVKKEEPRWSGDRRSLIFYCERCCEPSRYIEEWHVDGCVECYVPKNMRRGKPSNPSVHPYSRVSFCCECNQSLRQQIPEYRMSYAQTYDRSAAPRVICPKCNTMNRRHARKIRELVEAEIALRNLKRTAKEVFA